MDPARSRVVLVGTATYSTADPLLPDVPVVANNIADLAAVLTDPHLGGFAPEHCLIAPPGANQGQIGELLGQAADEAEDLLLFYYSGHGMLGPRNGELYLTLSNTRSSSLAYTALPFEAIRYTCLESKATNRVVILDSCFSGRAIGETLAGGDEPVLGQLQVAGTYTLTSAPANRTAQILPGEGHTAFTERMLALLRAGSADSGEMISLGDIYRHLYSRLKADGLPAPQQRGTQTADLLGLVRNVTAGRMPAPLSIDELNDRSARLKAATELLTRLAPTPAVVATPEVVVDDGGWDVFDVRLDVVGPKNIQVIKAVRVLTPLSLREAKDLVDGAPNLVLRRAAEWSALRAKTALEQLGATVSMRADRVVPYPEGAGVQYVDDGGWDMFDIILQATGSKPNKVHAVLRDLIVRQTDRVPMLVLEKIDSLTAEMVKADLEKAGASVRLRPVYVVPARRR